jgi:hypothetical protein
VATWVELVRLMGRAHVQSARGVWRGVEPPDDIDDEEEDEPSPAGTEMEPRVEVQRFVFQAPNRWRISTPDGRSMRLCDGDRVLMWRREGQPPAEYSARSGAWGFSPDPLGMLRRRDPDDWSRDDDYSTPIGEPTAATVLGRTCWRVDLTPPAHKTGVYSIWVDEQTGIRLRAENSVVGLLEEFLELELDGPVDASEFAFDGEVDRTEQDARDRDEAAREHYLSNPPPIPTVWPRGLGFHVWEGDVSTGAFVARLEVAGRALRARHPVGGPEWVPPRSSSPLHRWRDETWQWTLVVDGEPLTPDELQAVIASIPPARS